jgi:hypothetical protein
VTATELQAAQAAVFGALDSLKGTLSPQAWFTLVDIVIRRLQAELEQPGASRWAA